MPNDRRLPWTTTALVLLLTVGFVWRLLVAGLDDGMYWPDEIFQTLEPAHELVFGYALLPWEFLEGGRSWILPALFAAVWEPCAWLGVDDPDTLRQVVDAALALTSIGTAGATWWLARRLGARAELALLAAAGVALTAPSVYFGTRALPDPVASLPLTLGLALALPREATRRQTLAGAFALGLATVVRPHVALLAAVVPVMLALRRQWRPLAELSAVLAGVALVYGLVDRLTWGEWFFSLGAYWRANTQGGWAEAFAPMPPTFYATALPRALASPLLALAVPVLALASRRAGAPLLAAVAVFVAAHSLFPHKLLRFVVPVLPLVWAAVALGLESVRTRLGDRPWVPRGAAWVVAIGIVWSAVALPFLTMGDLGGNRLAPDERSAFGWMGEVRRLMLEARARPDLCGLAFDGVGLTITSGQSTLHRDVPIYELGPARPVAPGANYRITFGDRGGELVAQDGPFRLVRDRTQCAPDPDYVMRAN